MSKSWCSDVPGGVRLAVQISPNAKRSEVIGILEDVLKIRLQAQPIEGKANEALVRFIAQSLSVPKSAVVITHGLSNKRKLLEVSARHLTAEAVRKMLMPSV
jgi:uncharacterized protein (TIGR00251 family)